MTAIYATAEEAILASAGEDRITRCAPTPDNLETLLCESDDSAEGDTEAEFWGQDESTGATWRVHVARA